MLASVVPQHVLLVLAKIVAVKVWTRVRSCGRHHCINPLLEMELGQMILLLPVLVLGVRHKATDLALIPAHIYACFLELLVHLKQCEERSVKIL